jgi:hypothetical protein
MLSQELSPKAPRSATLRAFVHATARAAHALVPLVPLALLALGAGAARGDDRDLLRNSIADPYLFIILDTSGSMNWAPKTAACPTGDCFVPLQADDAQSKAYQAKQALFQVLTDSSFPKINLGFATYNQDQLAVSQKHWLYQATTAGVPLTTPSVNFPAVGAQEVFGTLWGCDTGSNDDEIGCYAASPANLSNAWETTRVQRLPKGGVSYSQSVTYYIKNGTVTYKVTVAPSGGSYGGSLSVKYTLLKCTNASCSSTAAVPGSPATVTFTPVSDFVSWDYVTNRTNPQLSYFTNNGVDTNVGNTCSGWDPNTDTASGDTTGGYDLRWPTDSSDLRGAPFTVGDVIPLDWKTDHKVDILKRLAPNYVDGTTIPDFRVATYLRDNRSGAETFLRLKDDNQRPIISSGSTPIGASLQAFRTWYSGCSADTCPTLNGWAKIAGAQDTSFECRQKYLLILTDGDETCGGLPCKYAPLIESQLGVTVFVVAFGVTATPGNQLSCMVSDPKHLFFPSNQAELIADLQNALGQIKEQVTTFASAAVPSVQAEIADRIYLSSFTPLNLSSIWDGHLDAYLKPLPLFNGKPDRNHVPHCDAPGGSIRSSCWIWDASAALQTQAPLPADLTAATVDASALRLGTSLDQRRVFYSQAGTSGALPATLRLFAPPPGDPTTDPDWADLFKGLNINPRVTAADRTAAKATVTTIIKNTLEIKTTTVQITGQPDQTINYLLGDIFHSDPVLVDRPNNFDFYSSNLYGNPSALNCTNDPGYKCFAQQQTHRRKMLLLGTNDGQLHAIDAGVYDSASGTFLDGKGNELFSYMPRLVLPAVRDQAQKARQIFTLDGTPRVDDVFLDPKHAAGAAVAADREWRTVAIGGFREGGGIDGGGRVTDMVSGYYALDVTHPDKLDSSGNPTTSYVPSCLTTDNSVPSGCGTLPFPAVLWEFTDSVATSQLDEDKNGYPDLGQTWSVPTIARIKVIEGGSQVDKFVAIFGGGMDADNKTSPKRGNWLYMVDIETGQTIYKRKLVGSAPSDPAGLDVDLNGYLDTIYIGTISGVLYKVDLTTVVPTLQDVTIATNQAVPALAVSTTVKRLTDTAWDPFAIFTTGGKPIYFAPTVFYVAKLSRFALAFGTGDREALWNLDGTPGRFYLIIDDNFTSSMTALGTLPKTEANYQAISATASDVAGTSDFVVNPGAGKDRGWFLQLQTDERVITQTFGLSGVIIFSSFSPQDVVDSTGVCARGGNSQIYVVYANNANSVMQVGGTATKFRVVPKFVTNPYVEQGSTKNAPGSSTPPNSEQLDATQQQILSELKKFFPKGTKFANYWISVSGIRSDTGYERYATIPVGIIERNWKEQ